MKTNFDLKRTEASWTLGLIPVDDLPNLAADAVAQGFESKALIQLAGVAPVEAQEASSLFQKALRELGVGTMLKTDALKHYAKEVSNRILNSEVTPLEGAKDIWRVSLKTRISGFHDLDPFLYAASELEERPAEKEFFEKAIMAEAKRWSTFDT
jgi:hypothetical protein